MAQKPLSKKETNRRVSAIKKAIKAGYRAPGQNGSGKAAITVAAESLGISPITMSTFVSNRPEIRAELEALAPEKPAAAEIVPAEAAKIHRAEEDARFAKKQLRGALSEISRLQERVADLEWSSSVSYTPADWSYNAKRGAKKSQHIPYLLASDFQIGEVINPGATDGNAYDVQIFRDRYRTMVETAIRLSTEHVSPSWEYPGVIYARGGDAISGGIHDELARTDELDPFDCVIACVEEETRGIEELAKAFGHVDVKSVYGNHGRIDKKPPSKNMTRRNYEYIITKMLMDRFRKDKRVSFQVTDSPDLYYPIYGQNICLTHGDNIGSRGGQGYIGPVATIARGAQKVIQQQSSMGRKVDCVHMGHFHTSLLSSYYMVNGSLPGYSEYAFNYRMKPEPPQQTLCFYSAEHGMVDYRLIRLD